MAKAYPSDAIRQDVDLGLYERFLPIQREILSDMLGDTTVPDKIQRINHLEDWGKRLRSRVSRKHLRSAIEIDPDADDIPEWEVLEEAVDHLINSIDVLEERIGTLKEGGKDEAARELVKLDLVREKVESVIEELQKKLLDATSHRTVV